MKININFNNGPRMTLIKKAKGERRKAKGEKPPFAIYPLSFALCHLPFAFHL